jgi:four helix bundle protein
MAKRIEDLPIFPKAMAFWVAVHAILDRPRLRRDRKLHDQINDANDSIPSNMREGFEQSSDDGFANFLVYSKGSTAQVFTRLHEARLKEYITQPELRQRVEMGEEPGRMLGGFIKYLRRSGFKNRGSHRNTNGTNPDEQPPA